MPCVRGAAAVLLHERHGKLESVCQKSSCFFVTTVCFVSWTVVLICGVGGSTQTVYLGCSRPGCAILVSVDWGQ